VPAPASARWIVGHTVCGFEDKLAFQLVRQIQQVPVVVRQRQAAVAELTPTTSPPPFRRRLVCAGGAALREIEEWIRANDKLKGSASTETIRRILRGHVT
jgi:hypothetical protein